VKMVDDDEERYICRWCTEWETIQSPIIHKCTKCGGHGPGGYKNDHPVGILWKKFKGFCKNCGIKGDKAINCHAAKKNITIRVKIDQENTSKCFSCNNTGHLAQFFPSKKDDTAFVGRILSYKPPEAQDKVISKSQKVMTLSSKIR
jgi:hypothetical protein